MTINLGGSRQLFWARPGNSEKVEEEPYQVRSAMVEDIPLLGELYGAYLATSPIVRPRDSAQWHYELFTAHPESIPALRVRMIEMLDGQAVAYAAWEQWGTSFGIRELGVLAGHSWRAVGRFLVRHLRREAETLNQTRVPEKHLTNITFNLGEDHPVYEALEPELERQIRPYAWYVRVPDIPAFLRHIAPALEARLARSVVAGYTGTLRINLYQSRLTLVWERGRLVEVGEGYDYERLDEGDALFPYLTFLQLLFSYRSIDELTQSCADLYTTSGDALVVLRALFPKRPSRTIPMG